VVHRDIKPQNILLREDGSVAVSDFGIARALASSTRSRTASVMGTPAYMSPEQWASGSLDGRIDQYALGIVFYEMLAGVHPSRVSPWKPSSSTTVNHLCLPCLVTCRCQLGWRG